MGLFDRIIGRNEYYDDNENEYIDEYEDVKLPENEEVMQLEERPLRKTRSRNNQERVVNISHGLEDELVIIEPNNIHDAQRVCDDVKSGKTVICNLERIDPVITQRVIDFILGGAYSLKGQVTSVSTMIFVVTPTKTKVTTLNNERPASMQEPEQAIGVRGNF